MTKEELIELSDLNREDNVKYISSEAQGIAIALDSDIYSPTLCKLERAYICGRRKSENRIAELEKKNAELEEQVSAMSKALVLNTSENDKQLAKAKDLLNEFMKISKASDEDFDHDYSELIGEADQFLKEKA